MGLRVDARDVLDPNAMTRRAFRGLIVGHYRPTGPNAWDDYEFVGQEQGEIDVLPKLRIQVEDHGARFRMRHQGRVIRVQWLPGPGDLAHLADADVLASRRYFLESYVESFNEAEGQGPAAVIARKLRE